MTLNKNRSINNKNLNDLIEVEQNEDISLLEVIIAQLLLNICISDDHEFHDLLNATSEAYTAHCSETPGFTLGFKWGCCPFFSGVVVQFLVELSSV